MPTWRDHRSAVKAALRIKQKSTYWLCQQVAGRISPPQVYGYLAGTRGLRPQAMQHLSDALGIVYTLR